MFPRRRIPSVLCFTAGSLLLLLGNGLCDVSVWQDVGNGNAHEIYTTLDMPAEFGPSVPSSEAGIRGILVIAHPLDGCTEILAPPSSLPGTSWIALIQRSRTKCKYVDKVYNAMEAGYNAAIVFNIDSDLIFRMAGDGSKHERAINISSVFVSESAGQTLKLYALNNDDDGSIPPDLSFAYPYIIKIDSTMASIDWSRYFWPFVITLSFCIALVLIFMIVRCVKDYRYRNRHRISRRHLSKIPTKKFSKATDTYEVCAVCLEDFVDGDKLRILPCNHAYHQKCIDPWLTKRKRVCPVCKRRVLLKASDHVVERSSDDSWIYYVTVQDSSELRSTASSEAQILGEREPPPSAADSSDEDDERAPLMSPNPGVSSATQTSRHNTVAESGGGTSYGATAPRCDSLPTYSSFDETTSSDDSFSLRENHAWHDATHVRVGDLVVSCPRGCEGACAHGHRNIAYIHDSDDEGGLNEAHGSSVNTAPCDVVSSDCIAQPRSKTRAKRSALKLRHDEYDHITPSPPDQPPPYCSGKQPLLLPPAASAPPSEHAAASTSSVNDTDSHVHIEHTLECSLDVDVEAAATPAVEVVVETVKEPKYEHSLAI